VLDLQTEIEEFRDREYRESYADEFLNTYVANQIRVIREERNMTQKQLADAIGTKQTGVSRFENVNYSGWNIRTLKKIAHALDCRLHISFETYGSLLDEGAAFVRSALQRPTFADDPRFKLGDRHQKAPQELISSVSREQEKSVAPSIEASHSQKMAGAVTFPARGGAVTFPARGGAVTFPAQGGAVTFPAQGVTVLGGASLVHQPVAVPEPNAFWSYNNDKKKDSLVRNLGVRK
jgi:transcriptional regulator with XRE-family HTH domain